MDFIYAFVLKLVVPFLVGFYGMKLWYYLHDRLHDRRPK